MASFGIFRESRHVSAEISKRANDLFNQYHKIEISKEHTFDYKFRMMDEWL